jgi:lipoprotein NlpD
MPYFDRLSRLGTLGLAVTAVAVVGCAAPPPAPIVSRTGPAAKPAQQATRPAPTAPAPAARPQQPPQPTVQTAPIRSGSVEARSTDGRPATGATPSPQPGQLAQGSVQQPGPAGPAGFGAPPGGPVQPGQAVQPGAAPPAGTVRTEPRGTKAPYSDAAMAEMRRADAAPPMAAATPRLEQPPRPEGAQPADDGNAFAWPGGGKLMQSFEQSARRGIVLEGAPGDEVLAAADGRVIFSGAGPRDYGNLVIVKHDNDLLSVYAHNRSLSVKEGQNVRRGQKIAEVGDSGTTSPRLHFEIRQQGKPVDPMRFLPRR